MIRQFFSFGALMVGVALFATGCGGGFTGFCEDQNLCEEGNEFDIDACTSELETSSELADLRNCDGEFDEWFDCRTENARCNDGRYEPDEDACDGPRNRLQRCVE
jgi:hypothetical protein